MSRSYRLGRSLGVASIALILVAGVAFAHDAIINAPTSDRSQDLVTSIDPVVPDAEVEDQPTVDRDEIDDVISGTPDVEEPSDTQDPEDVAEPAKPAKVEHHAVKPAKAVKATKTVKADSSTDEDNDQDEADEADDNDQHDGDHQGDDQQDGDHGDSDSGGDD